MSTGLAWNAASGQPGEAISPTAAVPVRATSSSPRSAARYRRSTESVSASCWRRQVTTAASQSVNGHAGPPQGRRQVAEFQMRVRIDQARQHGDIAQVARHAAGNVLSHRNNPIVGQRQHPVGNRRTVDRKQVTSFQGVGIHVNTDHLNDHDRTFILHPSSFILHPSQRGTTRGRFDARNWANPR